MEIETPLDGFLPKCVHDLTCCYRVLIERLSASASNLLQYQSSFALAGYMGASRPSGISLAQALHVRSQGPSIVTTKIEPGKLVLKPGLLNLLTKCFFSASFFAFDLIYQS